jgi:thioredoxin 1
MELQTRLKHIHSELEFNQALEENTNVMICCGRMGPMCLPVYAAMEILKEQFQQVAFYDIPFDHPEANVIRDLPECRGFMGLPFTVYFKNGAVIKATTSIQTQDQVEAILKAYY